MAEIFKFFNSAPGDERWHYASDFADYFGDVLSSGLIHKDNVPGMQVTVVANSLKTKVAPGQGLIKGYSYQNTTSLELTHDITEVGLNRIDRIVLRLDLRNANRYIKLFVKKGTEAVAPVAPELQRDNYIYELSLAQVKVTSNSTIINPLSLIDERMYEDLCGVVHSLISVPTSVFQQQFDVWFNAQKALYEADLATWTSSQKLSFNQWLTQQQHDWGIWRDEQNESFIDWRNSEKQSFYDWLASLQTILDGDVAGNLLNLINDLDTKIANVNTSLTTALLEKIGSSEKGVANGVATLNENGLVPVSQLSHIGSGLKEIARIELTSNAQSITFQNLDIEKYDFLHLIGVLKTALSDGGIRMLFNGDKNNNYTIFYFPNSSISKNTNLTYGNLLKTYTNIKDFSFVSEINNALPATSGLCKTISQGYSNIVDLTHTSWGSSEIINSMLFYPDGSTNNFISGTEVILLGRLRDE